MNATLYGNNRTSISADVMPGNVLLVDVPLVDVSGNNVFCMAFNTVNRPTLHLLSKSSKCQVMSTLTYLSQDVVHPV